MRLIQQALPNGRVALGIYGEQKEIESFALALYCAEFIPDYQNRKHPYPYLHLGAPDLFGYVILSAAALAQAIAEPESVPVETFLGLDERKAGADTVANEYGAGFRRKAKAEIQQLATEFKSLSAECPMSALAKRDMREAYC